MTLPWGTPKKTLLFRVKKTLYSGWQKFLILSPTCHFLGQKVVYYELYAKKMLVTKMTKKGGFYKVFQNQIIYRKNGQNRKIFHGYFLVEISVILSPCFFLIFFFQFYGEKNKKKRKGKKRSADDKNFSFLSPILSPDHFVSIKSCFFGKFLSPA